MKETPNTKIEDIFKKSPLINYCIKKYPQIEFYHLQIYVSLICNLVHLAWQDRDISNGEVRYIRKYLKQWALISSEDLDHILNASISYFKTYKNADQDVQIYGNFLAKFLNKKQKIKYIESMYVLSTSDSVIGEIEDEIVSGLAKILEIGKSQLSAARATAQIILSNKEGIKSDDLKIVHDWQKFQIN